MRDERARAEHGQVQAEARTPDGAAKGETAVLEIAAKVLIALNLLIHVYIVLLETVLFRSRGVKAFG